MSSRRVGWRGVFAGGLLLLQAPTWFGAPVGAAPAAMQPPGAALRTWKDRSGQFEIQAKFVSLSGKVVTLKDADGETVEIELDRLSQADRDYVTKQAANPFRKKAESPFRKKGSGLPDRTKAEEDAGSEPASGAGTLVKPSWDDVETLGISPASTEWKVAVPSAAAPAPGRLRPAPIPTKADFFDGPKGVVTNAAGTRAAVIYAGARPGPNQEGKSHVVLTDLENGKILGVAYRPGLYRALALSDDGTRVLMRTDKFGGGGGSRLEFWTVNKSTVTVGEAWIPYESPGGPGGNPGERDVRWAAFLGPNKMATVSEAGQLVFWQVKPLKPLATLQIHAGCTPALSPDRKRLAFAAGGDIGLFDVAANEVIALRSAPMTNMAWTSFAFSPSGKRLACQVFVSKLFVYEVADGSQYREVSLQQVNAQQPTVFTDDDHVMIGGQVLVDLPSQVRLWTYQGAERVFNARGATYFEIASQQNQGGGLIPAAIPQKGVQDALARALKDPNFFIVQPGKAVRLDVEGIPDAQQRPAVAAALTRNLARNEVRVDPSSPVVVKAEVQPGEEREISYRSIGAGFGVDHFKIRPQVARVRVLFQDQPVWEAGASTLPFFDIAHLKKDESLQDHVRKFEKPNYNYFGAVEFPRLLPRPTGRPGGAATLGVSQVTLSGVR